MTAFMEGCRDQTTHEYWVRRKPFGRDIGRPVRIALAIRPDACAHPAIAPRLSVVRIRDYETGTAVEVEALGETPAVVRAKATAEAPWRQIDFHDSDLNAAIAHVVDPVTDHRSLPARIDVLEQIAHFLYDNETVDRRGEVRLTEPDEKVTTITGTPKNVLALVAETVTAARGAYGEIGWTLDGIDRTGARIVLHSPQTVTVCRFIGWKPDTSRRIYDASRQQAAAHNRAVEHLLDQPETPLRKSSKQGAAGLQGLWLDWRAEGSGLDEILQAIWRPGVALAKTRVDAWEGKNAEDAAAVLQAGTADENNKKASRTGERRIDPKSLFIRRKLRDRRCANRLVIHEGVRLMDPNHLRVPGVGVVALREPLPADFRATSATLVERTPAARRQNQKRRPEDRGWKIPRPDPGTSPPQGPSGRTRHGRHRPRRRPRPDDEQQPYR